MRMALAVLFALAGASAASAQVVQDRYGPPRRPAPAPAAARAVRLAALGGGYDGRLLGWAGKAAPAPRPLQPAELARPAEAALRGPAAFTPSFAPQPRPRAERLGPEHPGPEQRQVATRSSAPFTPDFDPPVRAAPAARRAAAVRAEVAPQPARPQAAPARPAYALAGGPPQEAAQAAPPRAGSAPRFYSLHREYGRTPDAIPPQAAAPRYVLIGPPDEPAARAAEDDAPTSHGQF